MPYAESSEHHIRQDYGYVPTPIQGEAFRIGVWENIIQTLSPRTAARRDQYRNI